ncbi:hypothetical protein R69619_03667 [Paraburkholderia nemoris]|uniref:hypothetical protein n=1 Tax=Paraburkholderia nemoris TaxID=2793076 RepID=UPI00190D2092|nr:hypothetical protein [Paraburkholderia nemoris]MBK3744149.1 hypothetical protein [Paraburkholderia aspalathi]CAE6767254.1 hypothetical protein R69619_03667 [Paraburkholderia nemoris]
MNIDNANALDPEVFALTTLEKTFRSDDTAWQFLQLNEEYNAAFEELTKEENDSDALESILACIKDSHSVNIACAQDTTCMERFGIAAWLSPKQKLLPELKNPADSWFFPLIRPVQEDSVATLKRQGRSPEKREHYPWLTAHETPFGYGNVFKFGPSLSVRPGMKKRAHESKFVFVAIDCTVPSHGQLRALEVLAQKHRQYWNDRICSTKQPTFFVEAIGWRDIFRVDKLEPDQWRTVGIDTLGPIKMQIAECRKRLLQVHRELDEAGEIKHWPERFLRTMPKVPPSGSRRQPPAPKSNRYLKALLLIAQSMRQDRNSKYGRPINLIAEDVGILRRDSTQRPQWMKVFHNGMEETHVRRARAVVNKLYAWLVHAQVSFAKDEEQPKQSSAAHS